MGALAEVTDRALRACLDLVWPPTCAVCGDEAWESVCLCAPCADGLPERGPRCPRCGRLCGDYAATVPCVLCAAEDAKLDRVCAVWPYRGTARDLIRALKFRGRVEVAPFLAAALAESLRTFGVPGDLVVPVPLSPRRRRRRGFDQAALLARSVARTLDLEWTARSLRRRRHTPPQSGLPRGRRLREVRGAFAVRGARIRGRCILLVDDVMTTGATVRACALALRRAGAVAVTGCVVCRTQG